MGDKTTPALFITANVGSIFEEVSCTGTFDFDNKLLIFKLGLILFL